MPGIAGIIRASASDDAEQDLHAMVEAMRHERHYSSGRYTDKDLGLYVGWIGHRGAFSDCMPLIGRTGDVVLIFHGENYLDDDSRDRLNRSGRHVDELNARYLLDLYAEFGEGFLRHLNGWYSGLLVDRSTRRMIL